MRPVEDTIQTAAINSAQHARLTTRAAALSTGVALLLIVLKAWAWLTSSSVAMLASLADSTLDFVASLDHLLRGALRGRAARQRASFRPRQGRGVRRADAKRVGGALRRADRDGGDPALLHARGGDPRRRQPRRHGGVDRAHRGVDLGANRRHPPHRLGGDARRPLALCGRSCFQSGGDGRALARPLGSAGYGPMRPPR